MANKRTVLRRVVIFNLKVIIVRHFQKYELKRMYGGLWLFRFLNRTRRARRNKHRRL